MSDSYAYDPTPEDLQDLIASSDRRPSHNPREPIMNHKDFELIAGVLNAERNAVERDSPLFGRDAALTVLDDTARHFASTLASTNARFDRGRFLTACGVK
jgi:hypothetical protein